jgi:hypothetical protein
MEKYQSIHNLLLRLGRVETVLRSMFIDIHHSHDIFDEPVKSGVDAKHRPRSRHEARQRSGIFPVGSREEKRLWHLRYRMSHFITTFSRYILDIAIDGNWQVLRRRLRKLQKRPPSHASRPATPSSGAGHDDENDEYFAFDDLDLGPNDEGDEDKGETQQLHKLHSIHSLVLYHHLIMDRILRSCLLHPSSGYQVAFKILMTLFGICLDFAKTVKEIEKGLLGWMDGAERIEEYWREWVEKETVFVCRLQFHFITLLRTVLIDSLLRLIDYRNELLLNRVTIRKRGIMISRCCYKASGTVGMGVRGMVWYWGGKGQIYRN